MRKIRFLALLLATSFPSALHTQDLLGKISCHAQGFSEPQNRAFTKKLWDGYEISLGPARNSEAGGDECTAAIYNEKGRVVYRTTEFNVIFDDVFVTDSGGGKHCCWAYNVISLSPNPHKLFDIDAPGAVRFEKDNQERMVIWRRTAGPYRFTSMSRAPFAEKVSRVRDGKLVDATPEFTSRIFSDENEDYRDWARNLTPENIEKLESTGVNSAENQALDGPNMTAISVQIGDHPMPSQSCRSSTFNAGASARRRSHPVRTASI